MDDITLMQLFARMDNHLTGQDTILGKMDERLERQNDILAKMDERLAKQDQILAAIHESTERTAQYQARTAQMLAEHTLLMDRILERLPARP